MAIAWWEEWKKYTFEQRLEKMKGEARPFNDDPQHGFEGDGKTYNFLCNCCRKNLKKQPIAAEAGDEYTMRYYCTDCIKLAGLSW